MLWRLRIVNGTLTVAKTAEAVKRVALPPYGYQCDSTTQVNTWWDTGDLRLTSAFYDADTNRLYAATAVAGNAGGGPQESVIRWYEAAPKNRSAVPRCCGKARSAPPTTTPRGPRWPRTTWARCSSGTRAAGPSECLGIWAATVPAGAGTAAQTSLIAAGGARYEFGPGLERWGDFSAANRDPVTGGRRRHLRRVRR